MTDLLDYGLTAAQRRRGRGGGTIPVAPAQPGGGATHPSSGSGGTSTGSSGTSTGTSSGSSSSAGGHTPGGGHAGGGSGGGGNDPGGLKAKASKRYIDQVATLQLQIDAVKKALGGTFEHALKRRLRNVGRGMRQADVLLMEGYEQRVKELEDNSSDNEKAAGAGAYSNLTNAGRERANALSQAALQGAGESDVQASQLMSLRNWASNQNDITQNAVDTARSIQGTLTDLNSDTKTARANVQVQAMSDREQLWSDYYDQREQAKVAIGNLYGQQAELYGYANEAKASKKTRKKLRRAQKESGEAFDDATDLAGKAWRNPGVSDDILTWGGHARLTPAIKPPRRVLNSSDLSDAAKRPEGASLREW